VRILLVQQGQWGQRIAEHVSAYAPKDWQPVAWQGPTVLPVVIDDPEDLIPDRLPDTELLIVLTESPGLTDLAPDLAQRCAAEAVIVAIDKRPWAPRGLVRQVRQRLDQAGIAFAAPMPFCSLVPSSRQHPLIQAFAERFGRPELACSSDQGRIGSCNVIRETPCGNTRYIAERLTGVHVDQAVEQAGLLHHYYPCWGGMETDPVQSAGGQATHSKRSGPNAHSAGTPSLSDHRAPDHSPLHIAATLAQRSVAHAIQQIEPNGEHT
jgi:thymidylate synthase